MAPLPAQRAACLAKTRLLEVGGLAVEDVRCGSVRSAWSPPEEVRHHAVVFVRRGCFRRRADGLEVLADPAAVYFERPGEGQEVAHPREGGDACTQVVLGDDLLASIAGGEPSLPRGRAFTTAQVDLEHRLLLAAAGDRADDFELAERAIALVAAVLAQVAGARVRSGRPATARARLRAVDGAREALAASPGLGLLELAGAVALSPHHLSRVFRAETGQTISRYRNRVRVRLALERLAEGDDRLTRIAADLGFADHAHLTRVVRREVGATPSGLRSALRAQ